MAITSSSERWSANKSMCSARGGSSVVMVFGFDFFVQIADGVHLHRKSSRCVSLLARGTTQSSSPCF